MEGCSDIIYPGDLDDYMYSWPSWFFVVIFVPLVASFGVFSNCAFIFAVYRVRIMRSITNMYLVNLAIADSCLLIAALSQYIGDYIVSPDYDLRFSFHTTFGCSVPNFLIYLCYYASLWTVTLVSLERYLAICHTFWHRLISTKKRALRMIAVVWLIALVFSGFAAPYTPITLCLKSSASNDSLIVRQIPYCEFSCQSCAGILYITDLIQFFFAMTSNITMYTLIIYKLGKTEFPTGDESSTVESRRAQQTRNAVARMLIINGVLFFICLTPFSIANLESICKLFDISIFSQVFVNHLGWIGRVLFLVNSTLNPLVYSASNRRYRMAFRQAFGFRTETGVNSSTFSATKTCTTSQL